jgi:hypothetical protein
VHPKSGLIRLVAFDGRYLAKTSVTIIYFVMNEDVILEIKECQIFTLMFYHTEIEMLQY